MQTYPSNPQQETTARNRGWTYSKHTGWQKPRNFTTYDQERIERAERRRMVRGTRADG